MAAVNVVGSAVTLLVTDPAMSSEFFGTHLGFRETVTTEDLICLDRDDAAAEIVLERLDPENLAPPVLGPVGVAVSFTVTDIAAEYERLLRGGANITGPLRQLPGGRWQLALTDPNGVIVRLVEWQPPGGSEQP